MSAKVGRNEPCPCRSGKKYKRCCADRDAESARNAREAAVLAAAASMANSVPADDRAAEEFVDSVDEILRVSEELTKAGGAGYEFGQAALSRITCDDECFQSERAFLFSSLLSLSPRAYGNELATKWTRLLDSRLSSGARELLAHLRAEPPRLWRRSPSGDPVLKATPVSRFRERAVPVSHHLSLAPASEGRLPPGFFGWRVARRGETLLISGFEIDAALLRDLEAHIFDREADGPLGAELWSVGLELVESIVERDPAVGEPRRARWAAEQETAKEAWRARVAAQAYADALTRAATALIGSARLARAVARARPAALLQLVERAVTAAQDSLTYAHRLGVDVELTAADLLAVFGLDAQGHAPGLERDALSRHPIALLAVDPEGAGLPPVDPRMPIGAALAVATGPQQKALDKALTAYEREVRFVHLSRELFACAKGNGVTPWRYAVVQGGGLGELLKDELTEAPLSRLGLPKGTTSRLVTALRRDGEDGELTLGDLPSSPSGLERLRGIGEKTRDVLTDALEELLANWRWRRAGLDRAAWVETRAVDIGARDTLAAGLDQLDALFG